MPAVILEAEIRPLSSGIEPPSGRRVQSLQPEGLGFISPGQRPGNAKSPASASPERAIQAVTFSLVSPFQGWQCVIVPQVPRALPWADEFEPFRLTERYPFAVPAIQAIDLRLVLPWCWLRMGVCRGVGGDDR